VNLLVDTHALLWFVAGDSRLSETARREIESADNTCYISVASWWEMAIKYSLGRLQLDDPLPDFIVQRVQEGFRVLPIESEHVCRVADLPFHHRDPFDRLIICQAIEESMPVCTTDGHFTAYGIDVVW
jgi:PIN domain nuclease of toxin-antitoxin system